jgi:hypothetical protein
MSDVQDIIKKIIEVYLRAPTNLGSDFLTPTPRTALGKFRKSDSLITTGQNKHTRFGRMFKFP